VLVEIFARGCRFRVFAKATRLSSGKVRQQLVCQGVLPYKLSFKFKVIFSY
jgi:hypothetical protein